ncbi:peptidoglycan editing factor PgeF [Candidatus Wolfebacteria bacterium]|nr:peptidoglycan editing factor PgeF [Candidatus Wolfebacteria bacterium]
MLWIENKNIAIIFSKKSDGDMLFKTNDSLLNDKIKANRQLFFDKNNINASRLVNIYGAHGSDIFIVDEKDLGSGALNAETRIEDYDGLITNIKDSYLMITGADCFPVFFYNENKDVIAAAHCGWRGILKELPAKMIDKFKNEFSSNPADISIWIGPGIKSCYYDVPQERADLFSKDYKEYIIIKDGKIFLDLAGIIALQLTGAGIESQKITTHPGCTFCQKDKYFSYRRDKNEIIEANAFIINLK